MQHELIAKLYKQLIGNKVRCTVHLPQKECSGMRGYPVPGGHLILEASMRIDSCEDLLQVVVYGSELFG